GPAAAPTAAPTLGRGGVAVVMLGALAVVGAGALVPLCRARRATRSAARASAGASTRPRAVPGAGAGAGAALARRALGGRRRRLQAPLGALRDVEVGVEVRRRRVGLERLRDAHVEAPVDEAPLVHVVPV